MMRDLAEDALKTLPRLDVNDVDAVKRELAECMLHVVGKDPSYAETRDWLYAIAYVIRGMLSERYIRSTREMYRNDVKRVYYLSMEYLIGRSLTKQLIDLGLLDTIKQALSDFKKDFNEIADVEFDAALGNGGLGRLAACFLDSLATHDYPGFGYGIRYDYGMFNQRIAEGEQVEQPENWLRYGNPWEFERPNVIHLIKFHGQVITFKDNDGREVTQWIGTDDVVAMAIDLPISGYESSGVANLRLWTARSTREFDLQHFNEGNYLEAVRDKSLSENISRVLYPNDKTQVGQELRLKQEYFFVSASIQDLIGRYMRNHKNLDELGQNISIQLNDTHPALAVPELLRILIDEHNYDFDNAFDIVRETVSYTNHTLLPEALETWRIEMLEAVLPRHLQLIYIINDRFLRRVRHTFPGDSGVLRRLSLVDDASHSIRMAHLAIVGSHKVNGVAALHTQLLRTSMFPDFDRLYPGKFVNMTNGITPRRWLLQANPQLSGLITEAIGDGWIRDLSQLHGLTPLAEDSQFRKRFRDIKLANKKRLASLVRERTKLRIDPDSLFDTQVKRIHEYKRQLLNLLHVITLYNKIRDGKSEGRVPRTAIFGGKAAPGYYMAKLIVRLINDIAETVNHDPQVKDQLRVVFFPNYNVTSAEILIPGSDLSEQISTAGTEASGTGNMKFALNGALTIGTLDGANIEILEEVGEDNIFIFGLTAEEAHDLRVRGYDPGRFYIANPDLKRALEMIAGGFFSPEEPNRYQAIFDALIKHGDFFLLLADFEAYVACQLSVEELYATPDAWTRKAILNVANMGKFSSDRTIHGYAKDIWGIKPMSE